MQCFSCNSVRLGVLLFLFYEVKAVCFAIILSLCVLLCILSIVPWKKNDIDYKKRYKSQPHVQHRMRLQQERASSRYLCVGVLQSQTGWCWSPDL